MAAYTHHMKTVVIPAENEPDLAEIDNIVRENVRFVTADHLDTVLRAALVSSPDAALPAGTGHTGARAAGLTWRYTGRLCDPVNRNGGMADENRIGGF